jgi:hypothetical protein
LTSVITGLVTGLPIWLTIRHALIDASWGAKDVTRIHGANGTQRGDVADCPNLGEQLVAWWLSAMGSRKAAA